MRLLKFKKGRKDDNGAESDSATPKKGGTLGTAQNKFQFNKTWAAFGAAVLLGIIGVFMANNFIDKTISSMEAEILAKKKLIKVVVPRRDIAKGERIVAADMSIREIPLAYVDRGAVTPDRFEIAQGQTITHDIQKGRSLMWAHLRGGDVPTFSGILPEGRRAVTVLVDEVNSFSGLLEPQDRVDFVLTYQNSNNKTVTFVVLENILVLATGKKVRTRNLETSELSNEMYAAVTIEVTPEQAKKIILAQEAGRLTAVLRHPDDLTPDSKKRVTVSTLLDGSKKKKRPYIQYIVGGR